MSAEQGSFARGATSALLKGCFAGAIQREGEVRLERISDVKQRTLHDFIAGTVKDEAEAIYTDELKSCLGIADDDTASSI